MSRVVCPLDGVPYAGHALCGLCGVLLGAAHAVPSALTAGGLCDRCELEGDTHVPRGAVEACDCDLAGGVCLREMRAVERARAEASRALALVAVMLLPRRQRARRLAELTGLAPSTARHLLAA